MDALKAQIAAQKRKAAESAGKEVKYMRRGDVERLLSEKEQQVNTKKKVHDPTPTTPPQTDSTKNEEEGKDESDSSKETLHPSRMEVVERLRRKGEPIRIFGESDKDCRLRLRALELLEEHDMTRKRLKKDAKSFEPMSGTESAEKPSDHDGKSTMEASDSSNVSTRTPARLREGIGMNSVMDLKLIWTDTPRVYPIIYYTLKGLLADWEEALSKRPDNVRNSAQGQQVTAMQAQTAEYLKPLFKSLRKRALEPDMLLRIAEIVHYMQLREYRKANDSYLQLSIGNAPWPIGITMAGIHERSADEKLYTSRVAHVLNDEVSRKYIQSLKRLMTFAQSHYPPDDLSKLMG